MPFKTNKKKRYEMYAEGCVDIKVTFTCGECKAVNERFINPAFDLHAWNEECDTCGSHSEIYIDIDCISCGRSHKIILQSD